jgi:hypothetical protein
MHGVYAAEICEYYKSPRSERHEKDAILMKVGDNLLKVRLLSEFQLQSNPPETKLSQPNVLRFDRFDQLTS